MLSSLFTTLGSMIANKKLLSVWLIALSLATAKLGEMMYVSSGKSELQKQAIGSKLDEIGDSINRLEKEITEQGFKLDALIIESARVRTELDLTRKANGKKQGPS